MRLDQQLAFILEIDKLKTIARRTLLTDASRHENSSEHSWHIAVMAGLLEEHAAAPVETARVIQMLLIHDVVEVDAGDTYAYDDAGNATKLARELAAADRIFGLLPPEQGARFRALWDEFEAMATPESRYANALDRIQAALLNFHSGGIAWREHGIRASQVIDRMQPVKIGAPGLWPVVERIVAESVEKGYLARG
jgi:putative hydrolases of HD superfamily